jgi:methionine sulfoxide reductase catalytic subunit
MNIIKTKSWNIKSSEITNESIYDNRRKFLKTIGLATIGSEVLINNLMATQNEKLFKNINKNYGELKATPYDKITNYNNFYEFSMDKTTPSKIANSLNTESWTITIDGLVDKEITIDMDKLIKKMQIEERTYRFRCVEGWSMVIPWNGFVLSDLLKMAGIKSNAKYVAFQTKYDPESFPEQKNKSSFNISFPYVEGIRLDEAMNPLTFLSVGLYGKILPKQNGAPIRLVLPWKYGFKSIKSITKITLTEHMPITTWNQINSKEYGFYANVNPEVSHPRWTQSKERLIGSFFKKKTLMFNGYEKEVSHMYKNMNLHKNF